MFFASFLCLLLPQDQDLETFLALQVGKTVTGIIEDSDLEVETETLLTNYKEAPTVGKSYRLQVDKAGPYFIELRSYFFDAYLILREEDGQIVGEDDDGLLNTHARLTLDNLKPSRTYYLETCALNGKRGSYDLCLFSGLPPKLTLVEKNVAEVEDAKKRVRVYEEKEGPESLLVVEALDSLFKVLYRQGLFATAQPITERALNIRKLTLGSDHPEVAKGLNNHATILFKQGGYAEARPLYERALEINEKVWGAEHPETLISISNLAVLLKEQGLYDEAIPLYKRALEISESTWGPEHPKTAIVLNNFGGILRVQHRYSEAQPFLERALKITLKNRGPWHRDVALMHNNLGSLLFAQRLYAKAQHHAEQALKINESLLGPEHPQVAPNLETLGRILWAQCLYSESLPYLKRALDINEKKFGPDHPHVARSTNNLAGLMMDQGQYSDALSLYKSCLRITEKVYGPEHPTVAISLSNLAGALRAQNLLSEARPHLERALEIRELAFGKEHLLVASSLNNLAVTLDNQSLFIESQPLHERALSIREKVLEPNHPFIASSLNNLALTSYHLGNYEEARIYLERSLRINKVALGSEHPNVALVASNLAGVLSKQDRFTEASRLYKRALKIREKILGPEHPDSVRTALNLCRLYIEMDAFQSAWDTIILAIQYSREHLERQLLSLSDEQRFLARMQHTITVFAATNIALALSGKEVYTDLYEIIFHWKGMISRSLQQTRQSFLRDLNPEEKQWAKELSSVTGQLSRLYYSKNIPNLEDYTKHIAGLQARRQELLAKLASQLEDESNQPVSLIEIRNSLPPNGVLIDFFFYPNAIPGATDDRKTETRIDFSEYGLIAWVVQPDKDLLYFDLGPATEIVEAVRGYLQSVIQVTALNTESSTESSREWERLLHTRLWKPLASHLKGAKTIFISPDRALGTLPFETIMTENGKFLIEDYQFVYLQDVSKLTKWRKERNSLDKNLLVAAGVNYDERETKKEGFSISEISIESASYQGDSNFFWKPVNQTAIEGKEVLKLFESSFSGNSNYEFLEGIHATEERMKEELPQYNYLHLATGSARNLSHILV